MKKIFAITLMLLMSTLTINAQINDLTEQDIQAFKDRVGEVIDMFQNNLSILGSKKHTSKVKAVYKKSALKLFMGEGLPYKDLSTGEERKGVQMQVSKIVNGKNTIVGTKLLTEYLDNLIKLPYAEVKMTKADTYRISNIYKVGDHYEATATIFQRFEGYVGKEMKKKYVDVTQKNIKVYIVPENDYVLGQHWSVRLGDIEVVDTTN
ncbi:MAG: hypothetical protein IKQ68_04350 [Prevotella sp.]|nr:hypothetical protein [Prevotella sp.]